MSAKLVIIGGGYVGCEVARRLDAKLDVSLVEPRTAFLHVPALIRSLVEPGLLDRAIIPYDKLLRRGRIIQCRASEVKRGGVMLEDGRFLEADLVLVATGSRYPAPFKPLDDNVVDFQNRQSAVVARLNVARSVTIVGAGPVGIELAGEIASTRSAAVSLVSSADGLLPEYPARLGQALTQKLTGLGVEILSGRRAVESPKDGMPKGGEVMLDDGSILVADIVFAATGPVASSGILSALPGVRLVSRGRVLTDDWLRPSDWPNLFVGGDVAEVGDAMTIVATMRQVPFLLKVLREAAAGKNVEQLRPYRPWNAAPILVPLNKETGNSFLPLPVPTAFSSLGVTGNVVTRLLKGSDLFIPKYRKVLGYS